MSLDPGLQPPRDRSDPVVDAVGAVLSRGTWLIIGLVGLGTIMMLAAGRQLLQRPGPPFDPLELIFDLFSLRPEGFLWLGLVLTVALPTARTVVAFWGFLRQGDRRAGLVAGGVLGLLALSVVVALVTR
jgi:hypothetical protein